MAEMTGRQFRLGCRADWRNAVAAARFYRLALRYASRFPQQNRGYANGRPTIGPKAAALLSAEWPLWSRRAK
jgi:hypothetical protein